MKFFIKANLSKPNSLPTLEKIILLLSENGHECSYSSRDVSPDFTCKAKAYSTFEEGIKNCDTVISVGGDGTMLEAARTAAAFSKPVVGVNTGHLGFLTAIEGNQLELLQDLGDKDIFEIKKHCFLKASINGKKPVYCLNDVVISKGLVGNTVNLSVDVNGSPLMNFTGDGLILSSSTGSTAYSLAVGGPIVDTDLAAMVVSPVAPHALNRTSTVLGKSKTVTVKIPYSDGSAYISFDGGDYTKLCREDALEVSVASKYLSVYSLKGFGQLEKIDRKLKLR